jgi:hypothetical protein
MQIVHESGHASSANDAHGYFTEWLLDSFNRAAFCLMASVGHRCGLFDATADRRFSQDAAASSSWRRWSRMARSLFEILPNPMTPPEAPAMSVDCFSRLRT